MPPDASPDTLDTWPRIEAAFDRLLDLPPDRRDVMLTRIALEDATLAERLRRLLTLADSGETWLDRPAIASVGDPTVRNDGDGRSDEDAEDITGEPPHGWQDLSPGQRVGAYEVVALIGRGGMGCVYRAKRVDGQFEQQVALKLIRPDAIAHLDRFQSERQILAHLEHPGITRILDGGVLDGLPYMVMELVDGHPITTWCRERNADLALRLDLFLAVCDAVAYAHRTLVVHRDLKPGNVLVTPTGQVKLLDFGIAKRMSITDAGDVTRMAPLSPGHAAPEQLLGDTISTATDSYALGILLYELLAGRPPWAVDAMPLARALNTLLHQTPPLLSHLVQEGGGPIPAPLLAGDLDAITAKALRKEPGGRYPTVDALAQDIRRMREGWPVSARTGSRLYVAGRFIRRHRLALTAVAMVTLAVLGGLGGVSWQYLRAEREAARANTIRAFVLSLYAGTDAGFPTDTPRRDVTAEKLLDLGVDRIEREFAADPALALDLYSITIRLYDALNDPERAAAVTARKVALARRVYGESHPVVIEALLHQAWDAMQAGDQTRGRTLQARIDGLLRQSGQDDTGLRAEWWLNQAESLSDNPATAAAEGKALETALDLYQRYAPDAPAYPSALQNTATYWLASGSYAKADALFARALDRLDHLPGDQRYNDTRLYILVNRGGVLERLGPDEAVRQNYERGAALALTMQGQAPLYWLCMGRLANLDALEGNRAQAQARYAALMARFDDRPGSTTIPNWVRINQADSLVAEGAGDEVLPVLPALRQRVAKDPDAQRKTLALDALEGLALQQTGKTAEARAALTRAMAGYATRPDSREYADRRSQLAWMLLDQGDATAATPLIDAILKDEGRLSSVSIAPTLAWAGRARLALAARDISGAKADIARAFTAQAAIRAVHDARLSTTLRLVRADILLAAGDRAAARRDATRALADARRMDAPQSPVIRRAEALVAATG